ncbi:hypothetical protein I7I50_01489 [Histoplasma capsulatum G186AR]|uniref:Uncharacterized protein n=1 Tax=Ajellomyces capsulatus TaxID=5037 RepID=A0A8H7YCY1_AJECA|nr:hypothetical protein I7I52_12605 [Histoplasma capsulatum]QSS73356.1 hypothetical protein I7I50_01489 [Histoplasma capsulatum G186AR]
MLFSTISTVGTVNKPNSSRHYDNLQSPEELNACLLVNAFYSMLKINPPSPNGARYVVELTFG